MQEKISIKGNIIKFDINTNFLDIEDILKIRFEEDELEKNLNDLHDPYLLKDMDKAVERIKKAKINNEKIMIFGDYDVDGVTSTAILMHVFKKIGILASYRLPNRIIDGYGMKNYFIDEISSIGVHLIITVDCGIRDTEVIKYAKTKGIDIIVTDHHSVPEIISNEAIAIINPKRLDCDYPFKFLSGAGVALKLVMALSKDFLSNEEYLKYIQDTIDIVAIGTVADCMPLIGENRIIVLEGLKQIKNSRSNGIKKLIEEKLQEDLDADTFSFLIGPKLNAVGRLDTPYKAVNLILNNGNKINEIIEDIEKINNKRKDLTKFFFQNALQEIDTNNNVIFYVNEKVDHGIIGIIAGKLTEIFHKPTIVLKNEGNKLVASCRSPEYFSIMEHLEKYKDYFLHFGGHSSAAGFSISSDKYEEFKEKFIFELNKLDFSKEKKVLIIDKIISPNEFGFNILTKINKFKPYGVGNPRPVFMFKDFEIEKIEYLGKTFEHITIKNKYGIGVLGFSFGKYYELLKKRDRVDIIFDIMENIWLGKRELKAKILDICL